MKCMVCGETATRTAIREDIEAAFCDGHYPMNRIQITVHSGGLLLVFVRK